MKINADGKTELERFDNTMNRLLSVPHERIKQKLSAKEKVKKQRRKRITYSVSRVAITRASFSPFILDSPTARR
jgi:hypothetical protein